MKDPELKSHLMHLSPDCPDNFPQLLLQGTVEYNEYLYMQ